jgi:hypothetical protein
MTCAWCKGKISAGSRRDAKHCSKRCRQASWRFGRGCVAAEQAERPIRLAYADPPYPGLSWYYRDHPDYAGEVDHRELLSRLELFDGWALSTSADALPLVLALCADLRLAVRVGAWLRGERRVRSSSPLQSWESVVYAGGRRVASLTQPADSLVCGVRARTTDPQRVIGAKPAAFCWWMFSLLGAARGDTLDDLYPGSGGVMRAWRLFQDASPRGMDDGSLHPGHDTSLHPGGDASQEYSPDVSSAARADASARTSGDGPPRGLRDASPTEHP